MYFWYFYSIFLLDMLLQLPSYLDVYPYVPETQYSMEMYSQSSIIESNETFPI